MDAELLEAVRGNALLGTLFRSGATSREMILALVRQNERLASEILHLQNIAPRRYRLPDGKIVMWRCPDELVPIQECEDIASKQA